MAEYIEREALIKEISESAEPFNTGSVFRAINRQTVADVAPVRHGRWEWLGPYRYNNDGVIGTCSVCKERLRLFTHNYCPNCGAKMDGGEQDA